MTGLWKLGTCDALEGLRGLPAASVDAIVTDPPSGIGFMGQAWDKDKGGRDQWVAWLRDILRESLRVVKPGAFAAVWALPRTSHWTMTAVEDAGFDIRDVLTHHFGSGFPKSRNLGSGIGTALKPATEDWILARAPLDGTTTANQEQHGTGGLNIDACRVKGNAGGASNYSGVRGHEERSAGAGVTNIVAGGGAPHPGFPLTAQAVLATAL